MSLLILGSSVARSARQRSAELGIFRTLTIVVAVFVTQTRISLVEITEGWSFGRTIYIGWVRNGDCGLVFWTAAKK